MINGRILIWLTFWPRDDTRTVMAHLEQPKYPSLSKTTLGNPPRSPTPSIPRTPVHSDCSWLPVWKRRAPWISQSAYIWVKVGMVGSWLPRMEECDIHRQEILFCGVSLSHGILGGKVPWKMRSNFRTSQNQNYEILQPSQHISRKIGWNMVERPRYWYLTAYSRGRFDRFQVGSCRDRRDAAKSHGSVHVKRGWPRTQDKSGDYQDSDCSWLSIIHHG